MDEPRMYSSDEVSKIVEKRLRQVKSEPSGLAVVVAALADRVQRLEEHQAKLEARLQVLGDIG